MLHAIKRDHYPKHPDLSPPQESEPKTGAPRRAPRQCSKAKYLGKVCEVVEATVGWEEALAMLKERQLFAPSQQFLGRPVCEWRGRRLIFSFGWVLDLHRRALKEGINTQFSGA